MARGWFMTILRLGPVRFPDQTAPGADTRHERQMAAADGLVVHDAEALNCETLPAYLGEDVTPTSQFFRRSHFPLPVIDRSAWRLAVGGLVHRPLRLSLPELTALPPQTLTVTLECAGNGRARFQPPTPGVQWAGGAAGTAEWTGARLADVLDRAGIRPDAREIVFSGADSGPVDGAPGETRFERSLTVRDALESGALLAYAMNGRPLPVRHGYPLRLVVPGWYGVASVKWLTDIRLTADPFDGYFQTSHYVRESASAREPVRLQKVRSVITRPGDGQQFPVGVLIVRGVAWSGAAPVARVEVSAADGPWQKARLVGAAAPHGWQRWEFLATGLRPGEARIRSRAVDLAGNAQPEQPEWNRLGYEANFVDEITVRLH
jgi:DMSO/TMAO reductase YedYZ molybdopterin-dependent catalytic subunit